MQETGKCYLLSEDHQLLLITLKAGCKSSGIFGKITQNFYKNRFFANIFHINKYFHKLWLLEPALTDTDKSKLVISARH